MKEREKVKGSFDFSVIIPTRDEGTLLQSTVDSILATEQVDYEIIVVDDQSLQKPQLDQVKLDHVQIILGSGRGPARARNAGAAKAQGRYLVFVDSHVWVPRDWLARFKQLFEANPEISALSPGVADKDKKRPVGYGLSWDQNMDVHWLSRPEHELSEVPVLPSGCLVVRRRVFEDARGFNDGFLGYGHEDEELSLKLWLLGYRLFCFRDMVVSHKFRPRFPYLVKDGEMYYNRLRMVVTHLKEERIAKVIYHLKREIDLTLLLARLLSDDTVDDRYFWHARRKRNDDWLMDYFNIPF